MHVLASGSSELPGGTRDVASMAWGTREVSNKRYYRARFAAVLLCVAAMSSAMCNSRSIARAEIVLLLKVALCTLFKLSSRFFLRVGFAQ